MILAVVLALVCVGSLEAFQKCGDFPPSDADIFKVLKENKFMYYITTNHMLEDCAIAVYTEMDEGKMGQWVVYNESSVIIMHADISSTGDSNIFHARVHESGANYNLRLAAYQEKNRFCWVQCDEKNEKVDFWHCFATEESAEDSEYFSNFLSDNELEFDEFVSTMNVYRSNCANFDTVKAMYQ